MTRGIRLLAALLALATSGAVACSDPEAGTLPSVSPSPSATVASPTPSASVDGESLISATRHFYDVLEAASREPTTRTTDVDRLLHPKCPCQRIVDFLREQARLGRRIERPVEVVGPRVTLGATGGGTVFLTLKQSAGQVVDASGKVVERLAPSEDDVVIDFALVNGTLLITQIATDAK